MARKIMYAISNVEGDSKKKIYCENLEKNEYEAKYKGYLTCIKGCQARIKFTQRKNDIKFFSTWNKEGNLHEKSCPYHVDYKGKMGRKKLNAYYQSIELSEEIILRRLKRIYTFQEKRVLLNEVLLEYSLDLGPEICQEINNYCNYLNFSYQSDTCGLYDNYWRCFFEMLSTCFDILVGIKNNVDDILYRQYSV